MKDNLKTPASMRSRVEAFLKKNPDSKGCVDKISPEKLIEELHIHQIELEIQNEDLRLARENAERIQAKYINLYEFAPVGYVTLGKHLEIVEANLTAANLLCGKKSQILHRPFTDFVDYESQDLFYFYLARVRNSDVHESCELKLKNCDKKLFFAFLQSMVIKGEEPSQSEIRLSIIDIDERKLSAIALKESADNNEILLNLLPQAAVLLGRKRTVIAANRTARNRGVMIGEACPTETLTGKAFDPAPDESLHRVAFLVDDNDYRQRLISFVDDSNDAVCLMDLQGNIISWNRMAETMYGYSTAEAMKMSVFDIVPLSFKKQTDLLLSDISAGAMVKRFESKRLAKDGCILDVCITATRVIEDGVIIAVATTERDITSHNLLFSSLQELQKRIIIAREEEKSRISQVLHAELGQSLIALKLFAVIAASDLTEENLHLQSVFSNIRTQLDKIIRDTRTLAHKLSPPGLRYVGLVPAIKELVESATTKKLRIRFLNNDTYNASFKESDIMIYRILQEALENIRKHSQATRVQVSVVVKKTILIIKVIDNGRGFDSSQMDSARGIGLALMHQQAALISGKLTIESQEGKGTLIKIRVPIKETINMLEGQF